MPHHTESHTTLRASHSFDLGKKTNWTVDCRESNCNGAFAMALFGLGVICGVCHAFSSHASQSCGRPRMPSSYKCADAPVMRSCTSHAPMPLLRLLSCLPYLCARMPRIPRAVAMAATAMWHCWHSMSALCHKASEAPCATDALMHTTPATEPRVHTQRLMRLHTRAVAVGLWWERPLASPPTTPSTPMSTADMSTVGPHTN
jgi:hypothetical protein